MHKPITSIIKGSKTNQIIDLGSGGGGGLIWLSEELKKDIPDLKILLTDYYPNISAFKHTKKVSKNIDYIEKSIDARNVPKELSGIRTQFLSLHHFNLMMQKNITKCN